MFLSVLNTSHVQSRTKKYSLKSLQILVTVLKPNECNTNQSLKNL